LGEDVTLSLRVAQKAKLANVSAARIFHDSQPGAHKASVAGLSRMQLVNRHYIMTQVMGQQDAGGYLKLMLWEFFQLVASACRDRLGHNFRQIARGRMLAIADLLRGRAGKAVSS